MSEYKEDSIKKIQQERGSVYGKFRHQAVCVGKIIKALTDCSVENGEYPTDQQIGSFAYVAVKLARYAVSPNHEDTLTDLESYCNLIKKMEMQDVEA